jgi:preprotein translocase subunit SecY
MSSEIPELRNKILFTLGLLAVYRIGFWIPIPGVNEFEIAKLFQKATGLERPGRHQLRHDLLGGLRAFDDLRPGHHAVHLGIDYFPARRGVFAH